LIRADMPDSSIPEGWDCHVHVFDADAPALPGHYRPPTRTLAEIEGRAAAHGVGHLVLVQPSVYGTDNTLMLQALRQGAGRHRGVAVVDRHVGDAELDAMHGAGVRGVRFNLVSPVGLRADPALQLRQLAPRLRERGWHVQWYLRHSQLADIVPLQRADGPAFVLDHLAGIEAGTAADDPAWQALAALADGGAWVKLSGWYRLGAAHPYAAMHEPIRRVAALFGDRLIWGSDWPHTSIDSSLDTPYDSLWQPVREALAPAIATAVRQSCPLRLYGGA
jgi:predicted TIM-barrel fold metal-dependent hydrolase